MWFQRFLELDMDYMLVKNLLIATNEEELKQIEKYIRGHLISGRITWIIDL